MSNGVIARLITEEEKDTIVKMMEDNGWKWEQSTVDNDQEIFGGIFSLFFTIPIDGEMEKISAEIGKNHFTPLGWRYVSIFSTYANSHVRGEYRGHKCRYSGTIDILNIFSYGKNNDPVENAKLFLDDYKKLNYNKS